MTADQIAPLRTFVRGLLADRLVGVLRGTEAARQYKLRDGLPVDTGASTSDDVSISIHVYGGNVGALRRKKLDENARALVDFVSGYTNDAVPNLWST